MKAVESENKVQIKCRFSALRFTYSGGCKEAKSGGKKKNKETEQKAKRVPVGTHQFFIKRQNTNKTTASGI